jgi:hypothetical protein
MVDPCFLLSQYQSDLCCWGRRAYLPLELQSFCVNHAKLLLQYLLQAYFVHSVKLALYVCTRTSFYLLFKQDTAYQVFQWKAKPYEHYENANLNGMKPLHFRRIQSETLNLLQLTDLLFELPSLQIYCLLETPLTVVDVVPNLRIQLHSFDVRQLNYDPLFPAITVPENDFIPPHILSVPFVMLINGSSTPDPRFSHSGTMNLWTTLLGKKHLISNLRYGLFLQQIKSPIVHIKTSDYGNRESAHHSDQFACEL